MAKTQTITLKKTGSSWSSYDEALADIHTAISDTPQSTDDFVGNTLPHVPTTSALLDVGTQELGGIGTITVEVRFAKGQMDGAPDVKSSYKLIANDWSGLLGAFRI